MYLGFIVCRKACFVRGTHFPAAGAQTRCEQRGLLQLMAHRPIAIDGAGADGSAEVLAALNQPGPSNDTAVMEPAACIDQVVVPTAPPRPSARDKDAVRHRVVNKPRLPKPPKSQHWVWKHFYGVREGGASQHRRLPHLRG